MTDTVDLNEPVGELCRRLGLEPALVQSISLWPGEAVATVYRLRDGEKYLDEAGHPATESHTFAIDTSAVA